MGAPKGGAFLHFVWGKRRRKRGLLVRYDRKLARRMNFFSILKSSRRTTGTFRWMCLCNESVCNENRISLMHENVAG